MKSRKDIRAIIGVIAGALVQIAQVMWPQSITPETANMLTGLIGALVASIILGIAHEDAGAKTGPPTPEAQRLSDTTPAEPPKHPTTGATAIVLLLVLGLGLLAGPVAAQTIDLSRLAPSIHGRQADPGAGWPGGYVVDGPPVILLTVRESSTGRRYYLDPVELAAGRAGLHEWLIAHTRLGSPMDRWQAQSAIRAEVQDRLRVAIARAAAVAAAQIPALLGRGDVLISGLLQGLVAR
jgi:hypothetical protein